ncbi:MAG TPA: nicotinate phosphoribosyltransferase, partial [Cyanobacteria bacterium UBA11367]|nr:nicotinate phosphoribosyltransferase [Cyanobacteria bacterium UBA11367]
EAPLWQAQLVETYILNAINYQTLIATKAARIRDVAGKESILLEFGTRRAFSPQASIWAARAALAGGFDATSNVLAALKLGRKP